MSLADFKYLHLYAQHAHHFESIIVGNKAALIELRNAIDGALATGKGKAHFFASDDEGYEAYVALMNEEDEELFQSLEMPYTEQYGDVNTNCYYVNDPKDKNAPYSPAILFKNKLR